jgi:alpha-2-macroglobulin
MRRSPTLYTPVTALFCAAILYLSACSTGNNLTITSKNFDTQIDLQQNLVFEFSHPLVPDSLLNAWDSTRYITFAPAVQGSFKWTSPTTLVFSPSTGFRANTDYKAELTQSLLANAAQREKKRVSMPSERAMSFHTPYLQLSGVESAWVRASQNVSAGASASSPAVELRLDLAFTYSVPPQSLTEHLQIAMDGKNLQYSIKNTGAAQTLTLALPVGKNDGGREIKLTIGKGLRCVESDRPTTEDITQTLIIPSPDEFKINAVTADYDDDNTIIRVTTSQSLFDGNVQPFVSVQPQPKGFSVEANETGFIVRGAFQADSAYQLTISKRLRGLFGGELGADFVQTMNFGTLAPTIKFTDAKAMYLSTQGGRNIGIRITNVGRVEVIVEKIYENNILAFLRNGGKTYSGDYDEGSDEYNSWEDYQDVDDYGDPVMKRVVDTRTLPKSRGAYVLNLDVRDKLQGKGLYIVRVISTEQKWLRDSRLIAISDIGMLAKRSDDAMFVVANSIKTAEPLASAEVRVLSRNNQLLAKAETNKDGVARLSNLRGSTPGSVPALVTTTHNGETTYLLLQGTRVETSRFEVGGLQENASGIQAFIYGERDMYRPGETVHFNVVARNTDWSAAAQQPIKLKILLPTGKEYTQLKRTLNDEGAVETALAMPVSAITGTYSIEAYTANDVLLASERFNLEEFLPDRISVNMNLSADVVRPAQKLTVTATALNLFGPPAANRLFRVETYLKRKLFSAKGFEKYNFAIQTIGSAGANRRYSNNSDYDENSIEGTPMEPLVSEGETGADGSLSANLEIPDSYHDIGVLQGSVYVTVFDENGRPVVRMKPFIVPTQDVFYGIKSIDRYQTTRQTMQIPVVALSADGKAQNSTPAHVRVIRTNWVTVLERDPNNTSRYRYVSQRQEITELERDVTVSGSGTSLAFTPRTSGEYEVRIQAANNSATFVSEYFYAYGYGDTQSSAFEVSKEGEITIESEKTAYNAGETANLLFKTPFAGKLLVTVERNGVLDYFTFTTDQKSAKLALPIKDEYTPNVYVAATLIKPLDDGSAIPLTIAYGYHALKIEKPNTKLPVSISVAEQSRSKTKQTITVQTGEDVELTIAIVDEGILQLKNFQTPDPHGFFYQKRALQVESHSVYPLLFPDLKARSSSMAGDAALATRLNPFTNKRVKLIAMWSGIVKSSGGRFSYTIDVPEFSGALRVMAVAYKGKSFGSATKTMRVADPIVISSGLPRFLSPGDEALMPVTLTNTTQREAGVSVQAATDGALGIEGANGQGTNQTVSIPANSERQVFFKILARGMGQGSVNVNVNGLGEKFSEKTDITIRPVAGLVKFSGTGVVKAGETQDFTLSGNFMQGTAKARLVVSKSPIAQFTKNLAYVLQYPYGCVEQITSSAFPQLYAMDLARSLNQSQTMSGSAASGNVQEAIRRLASMQLYNGALSYWQGGTEESWWGSAYAAHFLAEAQKAGFDVNEQFLSRLQGYLTKKAKERNFEYYTYADRMGGQYRTKSIPAKSIFYSLYVLALANKPDAATMNFYKSHRDSLALDSRYLLATAYFLSGDKASYRSLLPKAFEGERSARAFGGSFYSYVRDEAVALGALMDVEPDNPQCGIMARHLSNALKTERYLNTQENAMALTALGKIARRAAASDIKAVIASGGQKIADFTGADVVLKRGDIVGKQVSIAATGTGSLYYFWDTEGMSVDGNFVQEDSFLQVRRTYLTRSGQPLSPEAMQQNDLVVVKISLVSLNRANVENVVITDMLPAGLEIENPRVGAVAELGWIKDNHEPEYLDIRDDRINFFTTAEGLVRHYYYLARAVSKGTFKLGPVSADAMYNGEYHSYNGAGVVRVMERGKSIQ